MCDQTRDELYIAFVIRSGSLVVSESHLICAILDLSGKEAVFSLMRVHSELKVQLQNARFRAIRRCQL